MRRKDRKKRSGEKSEVDSQKIKNGHYDFSSYKNEKLKKERGISFEEIVVAVIEGRLMDIIEHPNKEKYPNQRVLVVQIEEYGYLVPFVEEKERMFLKTIIPSRKVTRDYIKK